MSGGADAAALAGAVAREFRLRMLDEYLPRIRRCVRLLTEEEAWRRPSPHGNSVANLLLHLEGNVRQWILCGLGGQPDRRDRPAEFAATPANVAAPAIELLQRLEATVRAAVAVVGRLTPAELLAPQRFQGRFQTDGIGGVLHVLEHFAGHAGQIYAWTKQLRGIDLKHYDL
jgi:hypothetical protein